MFCLSLNDQSARQIRSFHFSNSPRLQVRGETDKPKSSEAPDSTDRRKPDRNLSIDSMNDDRIAELNSQVQEDWYRRLELKRRTWGMIQASLLRRC